MNFLKSFFTFFWDILKITLIALVLAGLVRYFLVQPFLVNGASMEPNFEDGNYLLVDEISYRFAAPRRGEVVVFRYPNDRSVFFIKRLVGLPGERLVIRDGKIYIEGKELSEEYLGPTPHTEGKISVNLGKDEYFVLGDNRSYSFDSRNWGPIQREDIIGVARIRVFPFNAMNVFSYE